jgi:aryl-phospho-beta-D-glucosidase BglC (GH1 family)
MSTIGTGQLQQSVLNSAFASTLSSVTNTLLTTQVLNSSSASSSVYLSDLPFQVVQNGWGTVERDRSNGERGSNDGRTITLNGKTYTKGLGVHADSTITYALGGKFSQFVSDIGVDDEVGSYGSVAFQVWADGAKLYDSGTMYGDTATKQVKVDLTGKQDLKLVVTSADGSIVADHADWAGAMLINAVQPPMPTTTYLSDLPFQAVQNGWGSVERDRSNGELGSNDGRTITLNGKTYTKGLGVHANSTITYALDGKYSQFISDIGIDDEVGSYGSVAFQVWADGAKPYDSGTMYGNTETKQVKVDVTGKKELKLVVTSADGSIVADHADWADAKLMSLSTAAPSVPASPITKFPLSTRGNQIVDAEGKPVQLAGVNWFGINSLIYVPHGLWANGYREMIAQMKQVGFNMIRLPFSYDALKADAKAIRDGINYNIGSNVELIGKRPIEVMDAIIKEAGRQGMLVLLDNQNFTGDNAISEVWYQPGYTEGDWITMWTSLAERYRNQGNVIGADLKNEPHGIASWGTNNLATDWRLASERAGNAILSVNPNWLIIVEGISSSGKANEDYWWGGNLEGVKDAPVRLSMANRIIYSPHEYGPGLAESFGITPFLEYLNEPTFPNNLDNRWNAAFGYIHDQQIAPVLVGEFGGPGTTTATRDGQWQTKFVEYLDQRDMSWAYWAWNANAYDLGGGLIQDDWKTLRSDRIAMLKPILEEATPIPIFE